MRVRQFLGFALVAFLLIAGCSGVDEPKLLASARDYLSKEDNVSAAIQLKTLLQANPSSAEGRLLLGKALLGSGDAAGAEIELRRARELGQPDELVAPPLSLAMLGQRRYAEMIEVFVPVSARDL